MEVFLQGTDRARGASREGYPGIGLHRAPGTRARWRTGNTPEAMGQEQRHMTLKMIMTSRRWQHGSQHESAMGAVPTATLTGCLLCQVWLTSVGSRLVLTTALGSVHHPRPPLPLQLLGITVTDPGQFSWKPSSGSPAHCPSGGGQGRPSCLAKD